MAVGAATQAPAGDGFLVMSLQMRHSVAETQARQSGFVVVEASQLPDTVVLNPAPQAMHTPGAEYRMQPSIYGRVAWQPTKSSALSKE